MKLKINCLVEGLLKTLYDERKNILDNIKKGNYDDFDEGYLCGIDLAIQEIKEWFKDVIKNESIKK